MVEETKTPKPIHTIIIRCDNTDCLNNIKGQCRLGLGFKVYECGEYHPKARE